MKIVIASVILTIVSSQIPPVAGQWNTAAKPNMRFFPGSYPGNTVGAHPGAYPGGYFGAAAPHYPGIFPPNVGYPVPAYPVPRYIMPGHPVPGYPVPGYPVPGYPYGVGNPFGSHLGVPMLYNNKNSGGTT